MGAQLIPSVASRSVSSEAAECFVAGMNAYLPRPIEICTIKEALVNHLVPPAKG